MDPDLAHAFDALDSKTLGERIKAARLAAGLTQPQLADGHASVTYVSRIESGMRRPSVALLESFAVRLNVAPEQLIRGFKTPDDRHHELRLDLADLSLAGGDAPVALAAAEGLLDELPAGADPSLVLRARFLRATSLDALGAENAAAAYEDLIPEVVDVTLLLRCATALSRIYREMGRLDAAIEVASTALTKSRADALQGGEDSVRLSVTLAAALFETGQVEQARDLCESAIVEAERLKSPRARASAYWNASIIESEANNTRRALDLARRALSLLEQEDGVRDLARLRTQLGTILLRVDPPLIDDAKHQLSMAEVELGASEATLADRSRNDLVKARAYFLEADLPAARSHAEAALGVARNELPLVHVAAEALLGQIAWSDEDRDEARRHYVTAIQVLTGIGSDREAGQLWFDLGSLLDEVGLTVEAGDAYRRAATSTGLSVRPHVLRVNRSATESDSSTV